MSELIMFLIGLIVVVIVIGILWRAGTLAAALAPLDPTVRTIVYILLLLLLAAAIWYWFGGFVRLPRGG